MPFIPATRKKVKLKLCLVGASGSGKTKTALRMAQALVPGGKIAMIDTENDSGSLYAGEQEPEGKLKYDVQKLKNFSVQSYVAAIEEAVQAGYEVLIIDSLSHAWAGPGGLLELKDSQGDKNKFTAWRMPDQMYKQMMNKILFCPIHVIVTMRAKMAYGEELDANGKKTMVKLGMAPIMRQDSEYEFMIVGDLDIQHRLTFTKTRCSELQGMSYINAGGDVVKVIKEWLDQGIDAPAEQPPEESTQAPDYAADGQPVTKPPPPPAFTKVQKYAGMVALLDTAMSLESARQLIAQIQTWSIQEREYIKPVCKRNLDRIRAIAGVAAAPGPVTAPPAAPTAASATPAAAAPVLAAASPAAEIVEAGVVTPQTCAACGTIIRGPVEVIDGLGPCCKTCAAPPVGQAGLGNDQYHA